MKRGAGDTKRTMDDFVTLPVVGQGEIVVPRPGALLRPGIGGGVLEVVSRLSH